jgi:prepilin-type N-terminal cleavage/methylation domain-containing protein
MPRRPAGYSLVEILVVLGLIGVLAAAVGPSLSAPLQRHRARAALDRVASDLYYARALAVRGGWRIRIRFEPPTGCAATYSLVRSDGVTLRTVDVARELGPVCLSSNVPAALSVDSRGVLIGSPRTLRARAGGQSDSATVSLVGRLLRTGR